MAPGTSVITKNEGNTPIYVILFLYLFRLFFSSFPFGKLVRDVGFESIINY